MTATTHRTLRKLIELNDSEPQSALTQNDHDAAIDHNRRAYDQMALAGEPLCRPATKAELSDPLATVDKIGWLGKSIARWRVLCLAAGGGRQSALYAKAGADVTVVDISGQMLELDRRAAQEHSLPIRTIQANMQHLPMLDTASFDLIVHPVSTCYVSDVAPVFQEVARPVYRRRWRQTPTETMRCNIRITANKRSLRPRKRHMRPNACAKTERSNTCIAGNRSWGGSADRVW